MTTLEMDLKSKTEWIEVFPFGVAMGANHVRPVMIFKDKEEKRVLPVWLTPMDAGIAVTQGHTSYGQGRPGDGSPHEISFQLLAALGVRLQKCLFKRVKGHHQYVELHFVSDSAKKKTSPLQILESRADDAISFCLRAGCRFYATVDYMERSRVLESEIVATGMAQGAEVNPHPYLN